MKATLAERFKDFHIEEHAAHKTAVGRAHSNRLPELLKELGFPTEALGELVDDFNRNVRLDDEFCFTLSDLQGWVDLLDHERYGGFEKNKGDAPGPLPPSPEGSTEESQRYYKRMVEYDLPDDRRAAVQEAFATPPGALKGPARVKSGDIGRVLECLEVPCEEETINSILRMCLLDADGCICQSDFERWYASYFSKVRFEKGQGSVSKPAKTLKAMTVTPLRAPPGGESKHCFGDRAPSRRTTGPRAPSGHEMGPHETVFGFLTGQFDKFANDDFVKTDQLANLLSAVGIEPREEYLRMSKHTMKTDHFGRFTLQSFLRLYSAIKESEHRIEQSDSPTMGKRKLSERWLKLRSAVKPY